MLKFLSRAFFFLFSFFILSSCFLKNNQKDEISETTTEEFQPIESKTNNKEQRILKAGFIEEENIISIRNDGSYYGYLVEFLTKLSQQMNCSIEYIKFDNREKLHQALDMGIIDFIPKAEKTSESLKQYSFTFNKIGTISESVLINKKNKDIEYGDIEALDGMTIASQSKRPMTKYFLNWCKSANINITIKEFNSEKEVFQAVENGQLDGCLAPDGTNKNLRSIMNYMSSSFYMMFKKDRKPLKIEVDKAIGHIISENPDYEHNLYEKYFIAIKNKTYIITQVEEEWIKNNTNLKVAVIDKNEPFYSRDKKGNSQGVYIKYFEQISKLTGLKFEYIPFMNHDEAVNAVLQGKADILCSFYGDIIQAQKEGLRITTPFTRGTLAAVIRRNKNLNKKIKVAAEHWCIPILKKSSLYEDNKQNYTILPQGSIFDSFKALRQGKADVLVGDFVSLIWILNHTNTSQYKLEILHGFKYEISSAVLPEKDTLCSILDKANNVLSDTIEDTLNQSKIDIKNVFSFIASLNPAVITGLAFILTIMLVLEAIAIIIIIRRQKHKQEMLSREKEIALREARNDEQKNFFAGISHDIRTPLNAIIGYAELAEDEKDLQKVNKYYENIRASSEFLLELVNDLLTISKCSSKKFQTHLEPVKSDTIHIPVKEQIAYAAAKKGITFTTDISCLRPRVIVCDQLNIRKIIMNLLTNAVKYTPKGGNVSLKVANDIFSSTGMLSYDGTGDTIITVSDNGIGMSKEFQKQMFAPFSQEQREGFTGQGTGLGLSIAKQLTEALGGQLSVQSEINKGTTFSLRLHFKDADPALLNIGPEKEKKTEWKGENDSTAKKTVLVCEDNEINRDMLKAIFERMGYNVLTAASGLECLANFEKTKENSCNAIFMDLNMPVMGGLEATKRLRELERPDAKKVPIIAMTGDTSSTIAGRCLKAGMNDYIAKPAAVAEIKACLEKYI